MRLSKTIPGPALRLAAAGAILAAALGAGCASSNLSDQSKVVGEVVEALPVDAPHPSVVARAIWLPNASGFGTIDTSPIGHVIGVLALAGDDLYFMVWDESLRAYDVMRTIPLGRTRKIALARFGSSAMVVIESYNLTFDSFELMNEGEIGSDPAATEALGRKLQALRAAEPAP